MKLQTSLRNAIGTEKITSCPEWKYFISKGVKPSKTMAKLSSAQLNLWLRKITGSAQMYPFKEPQFITRELMIQLKPVSQDWVELSLLHPEGHIESYFLTKLNLLNRFGKAAA